MAAKVVVQLLVSAYWLEGAVTPEIVKGLVPEFVTVTVCAALAVPAICWANVKLAGDTVICALLMPLPDKAIAREAPAVPYGILNVAAREPTVEGEKRSETVHVALAANDVVQVVLATENSAALLELRAPTASALPPPLVNVSTGLIRLLAPSAVSGKA